MKGIRHGRSYGSLDDTIITIETNESTPLLVDHKCVMEKGASGSSYGQDNSSCAMSFTSDSNSNWSQNSVGSTKSFKSHFVEINVLAFAFIILAGLSIAVYLLIIETRLPSITFSLDLVHHDAWSRRPLPKGLELNPNNVDNVILLQTGSKNCDSSYQCAKVLQEMQEANGPEELPYNFIVASAGLVYEVRGWTHQSGMPNVPQTHTLVIAIMGKYDILPPENLLRTAHFLIKESLRRHKLQPYYQITEHP